ncbi:Uncharacterised protein [uncultured archaeon]|nr:Uncharacterised protein [uncultured archaeon]
MDGLCDACGQQAIGSCKLCGRRLCGTHLSISGVCLDCIGGRRFNPPQKQP